MEGLTDIIDLAQGGAVVLLTAAVIALWRRLNTVQDRFIAYLEESAEHGDRVAQRVMDGNSQ